jgi:hypothetical protein
MRAASLPAQVRETNPDLRPELEKVFADPTLLTVGRRGVTLDTIFNFADTPEGVDSFTRLRTALITFDAAIQQSRDTVACILYVVVAECLVVPNTPWGRYNVSKRFVDFYKELMPSGVDSLVTHGNAEEAFGFTRGAADAVELRGVLLGKIYDIRSGHVHGGLDPFYRSFGLGTVENDVKRSLFREFAQLCILEYMQSPRCSLVGHPKYPKLLGKSKTKI